MTDHDTREVLYHIQAILNRKGLTPCQLREGIGALVSGELGNDTLVCDKAWQKCEVKVPTIYPLVQWSLQRPLGSCSIHGGVFTKPESTSVA
jgi:hypothetical protein